MPSVAEILVELDRDRSLSGYAAAARKLKQAAAPLPELRVAILANHTFDIETTLTVELARRGFNAVLWHCGYDQYRQSLLDPGAGLDAFRPDVVLISLHLENAFPGVCAATCAAAQDPPDSAAWIAEFRTMLAAFRQRSAAPVFVCDFIPMSPAMDGILDGASLFSWTGELNRELRKSAGQIESVYIIGVSELAAGGGIAVWRDARMWYLARAGINPKQFPALAARIARSLAAVRRPAAKCLVLDLDNTVWGGVLGDAGPDGIFCAGSDYPANAYADFQRGLLALRARGILLAVASKNDELLVREAFAKRTDMPLRPEHISDWEVHWEPKPQSLRRIAARLNIGLDSLVFLDDNPAEIDLVRMTLPEVRSYPMPPKPEQFVAFLASLEDFDQLRLSAEDLRRADLYEVRRKQAEAVAAGADLESFYRSLHTTLEPEPAGPANFDRIVQLIGKTNQFNLTTRRHGRPALAERIARGSELWAFRASDVHGDHGIIAVALLDFDGAVCTIDTLLMSCRVIGRTLETAILHFLEGRAAARCAGEIRGEYLPTPKNSLCRDFYARHGFRQSAGPCWVKSAGVPPTPCPDWIAIQGGLTEQCAKT